MQRVDPLTAKPGLRLVLDAAVNPAAPKPSTETAAADRGDLRYLRVHRLTWRLVSEVSYVVMCRGRALEYR